MFDEKQIVRHGQAYGTGRAGAGGSTTKRKATRRKRLPAPPATDDSNAPVPPA
jgi:hypothetical protein